MHQSLEKRKEFHLSLTYELTGLDQISVTPIENDIPYFTSTSYLLEVDNFNVTLIVKTPRHRFVHNCCS